ncbi:MAG TPA: YidB family protein [Candidatus Binatia bacterium]|nr:YidB family protein [Candidatus Binatia bacterium]
MGLLDGLLGNVLGAALGDDRAPRQGQDPLSSIFGGLTGGRGGSSGGLLLQLALMMLQQNGGLEGVLGKFRQAGMGAQADSWVSRGQNMNISPDQLQQVFGSGSLNDIASQLGMSQPEAGAAMSEMLPELINQLTPQGEVTAESNDSIADALNSLSRSAGR